MPRFTHVVRRVACILAVASVFASPSRAQAPAQGVLPDTLSARLDLLLAEVERLSDRVDSLTGALAAPAAEADSASTDDVAVALDSAREGFQRFGFRAALAVLVLVLTGLVASIATWTLNQLAERSVQRRFLFKRIEPIVRIALWALGAVVVLRGVFDVDATTLLAAGAAIGVAVGFAAQDLLKNVFGGLVILGDRPFQVGDKISVGGTYGEVVGIGLRSTRLVTPDDNLVSVPNAQVVDGQVANANAGALDCQVVTELYLPGWVDVGAARAIAYRAAATSRYVFRDKPIVVLAADRFDGTFVTRLKVKAYVLDIRFEFAFMSDVTERAREAFVAAGLLPAWHGAYPRVDLPADWEARS